MEALTQPAHVRCRVVHVEDVGAARRRVSRIAAEAGIDATTLGHVELAVTELAANLLRHADPGGSILARPVPTGHGPGVEVVSVDGGPGIVDIDAALNGATPAPAGLGCGLAAVRRIATAFDVYTQPGTGTVVMARFLPDGATAAQPWAGMSVALDGADDCGDAWAVAERGGRTTALVVDGLGHGPRAAEAARVAVATFADRCDDELEALAERLHTAMRPTRGGAAALCRLDPQRRRADFVGVGNVTGRLVGREGSQAMVSLNGTLGMDLTAPRIRRMTYQLDGAVLVISTDGVRDGFDINTFPGLLDHDPLVIAALIHGQRTRGTDDATVVVVRPSPVGGVAA